MCSLCGVLGAEGDWTEASAMPSLNRRGTLRAERLHRVQVVNLVLGQFGLVPRDWEGAKYQLCTRTGRTEFVDNLSQVWQAAERMLGRACDPLDASVIERMEHGRMQGVTDALRDSFHPGQRHHRLSRQRQDHAVAAIAERACARRHRRPCQRIRRSRSRSSFAATRRRRDCPAAKRVPMLHHSRRPQRGDTRSLHASRARRDQPFRRLVVETTGLADPVPILSTVMAEPMLRHHFRLGNVVTTIDAVNGLLHLARHPESAKQAAVADRVVITKTDIADASEIAELRRRLHKLNPAAPQLEITPDIPVDPDTLLTRDLYDLDGSAAEVRRWLAVESENAATGVHPTGTRTSIAMTLTFMPSACVSRGHSTGLRSAFG